MVDSTASSLQKMRISDSDEHKAGTTKTGRAQAVADSWEDEADEDDVEVDSAPKDATPSRAVSSAVPAAPPPTPASPSMRTRSGGAASDAQNIFLSDGTINTISDSANARKPAAQSEDRRPDKTTAIASRLIAAAIGQRPAPRTKEQREYDQAMKAQERKRRDQAREEEARRKREKEQAQKDVWGD